MKRLSGGLVLLNLTAISLGLTSGEVDITDAGVLEELTELRQFIDVNRDFSKGFKNLKPILIEYRSSASKFNGIALANMSFHTDALHLTIGCLVNNNGKYLNISISVVYEWEDYTGYKVKSAKINAYEKTALTGATIIGDVDITGDVDVTGAITGDSIIENMSGYSFEKSNEVEVEYAGVCKNGNKITFSIFGHKEVTESVNQLGVGTFIVPASIYNAIVGGFTSGAYCDIKNLYLATAFNEGISKPALMFKSNQNQLSVNIYNTSDLTINSTYYFRYEVTFLLSDNLISNE